MHLSSPEQLIGKTITKYVEKFNNKYFFFWEDYCYIRMYQWDADFGTCPPDFEEAVELWIASEERIKRWEKCAKFLPLVKAARDKLYIIKRDRDTYWDDYPELLRKAEYNFFYLDEARSSAMKQRDSIY